MKLLLLEDDGEMRDHVARLLRAAGHVVEVCTTGRDAIFLATSNDYAVLILDRLVPDLDGLGALKAIRAAGIQTPALFLTALHSISNRVEGLDPARTTIWSSHLQEQNCSHASRRLAVANRPRKP